METMHFHIIQTYLFCNALGVQGRSNYQPPHPLARGLHDFPLKIRFHVILMIFSYLLTILLIYMDKQIMQIIKSS